MRWLVDQIREAIAAFTGLKAQPALIGGLALAAQNAVRATTDVDFLADADDGERLHALLLALGYQCIHRSGGAANYLRDDEGLDLLYAHRPEARRLLAEAEERATSMGPPRMVSAEGLIGFKLQGFVNMPPVPAVSKISGPCRTPIAARSTCAGSAALLCTLRTRALA